MKIIQPNNSRVGLVMLLLIAIGMSSSANAQEDPRQKFPQVSTMSPLGVDLQTGNYIFQGTDLTIGPLSVDHYVKKERASTSGGHRPFSNFATGLHGSAHRYTAASGEATIFVHLGQQKVKFTALATGAFAPLDSSTTGWKMISSGTTYILTNKSGDEYRLDTHSAIPSTERRLTSHKSANGHQLDYTYDTSARLRTVKSNRGYAVVLDYSGNNVVACGYNLALTQVTPSSTCSGTAYKVTYGRNAAGDLTSITDVAGDVVNIQYTTIYNQTYPICITLPNSSTCAIQNQFAASSNPSVLDDQVTQQTTAEGEVWNYDHAPVDNTPGDYTPGFGEIRRSFSWMTPPAGAGSEAQFGNGFIETLATPEGVTAYEYSSLSWYAILYKTGWTGPHYYSIYPSKITYPEGNSIAFTRDWADNVTSRSEIAKPGSGLANNITVWAYPTSYKWSIPTICAAANVLCDKPVQIADPNGNTTDFTYSATHGGMLTKTEAAVNGTRPQTRYTYVQRNARDVNGTALTPPVWVLASEEYCKTTAASGSGCAGGASDEVVTTYDYGPTTGPNNLLLRGTVVDPTGLNLRTCYTYDQYGRKISETQPLGTGSTCP